MFTSCPSYESMKMGWEVLAKLKVPMEVKNTTLVLFWHQSEGPTQHPPGSVSSKSLFPHHIQTHTIYFSLVFQDTFFKIIILRNHRNTWTDNLVLTHVSGHIFFIYIYSEESQEHTNRSGRSDFLLPWTHQRSATPDVFISLTPHIKAKEQPGEK